MLRKHSFFELPADAVDLSTLAFFRAIREMEAGARPVDLDCLIRLAEFILDAHAYERGSTMRLRSAAGTGMP